MPKVNYQYRNFELNSGPLILLANTLDEFSNFKSDRKNAFDKNVLCSITRIHNNKTIRKPNENDYKASDYIFQLSKFSGSMVKGKAPNEPTKKALILRLSKETSHDIKTLSSYLETLANAIKNEKIDEVDISLLRSLVKAIRESTIKEK